MTRIAIASVVSITAALIAAAPATSRTDAQNAAPRPCSTTKVGGAAVLGWCGPAKATVKLRGKTLAFKGGVCGTVGGVGKTNWTLNIGKYTVPPAKPKFSSFGAAGRSKAGTYMKGEFVVSFQLPGKQYALQGGPVWGLPWPKVTISAGGKRGTFSGHAFLNALGKGTPVSGSWTC